MITKWFILFRTAAYCFIGIMTNLLLIHLTSWFHFKIMSAYKLCELRSLYMTVVAVQWEISIWISDFDRSAVVVVDYLTKLLPAETAPDRLFSTLAGKSATNGADVRRAVAANNRGLLSIVGRHCVMCLPPAVANLRWLSCRCGHLMYAAVQQWARSYNENVTPYYICR